MSNGRAVVLRDTDDMALLRDAAESSPRLFSDELDNKAKAQDVPMHELLRALGGR